MSLIKLIIVVTVIYNYSSTVAGIRCYECSHVPSPAVCHDVTTCTADDYCYVEEFITSSGRVVFNSGCRNKNTCSVDTSFINVTSRSVRSTELLVCSQCCQGDFCNLRGCGKADRPRHERGPYCFDCPYMISPDVCDRVSVCQIHEQCSVYVPPDYNLYPTQYYSAGCKSNNSCNALFTPSGNISCPPTCCTDDHCNIKCGTPSTGTTVLPTNPVQSSIPTTTPTPKTTPPQTTVATTTTTQSTTPTTTAPVRCGVDGYHWVHVHHDYICIKVSDLRMHWGAARTYCQVEHGDLVVLETHEKLHGMKEYMKVWTENHPHKHDELLWIGLYDKENDGRLEWVDGSPLGHDVHWQHHGEPHPPHDPHGPPHEPHAPPHAPHDPVTYQASHNCVQMEAHGELNFGTANCVNRFHLFICERKIN